MTKEKTIKSALKFLVQKQTEQGSWGFSDDDDNAVTWNEVIEWVEQRSCEGPLPEQQRKTRKSMDRSDFIIRKKLEHTNDIPAASVGDVGYVSIVGQPVIVLDKNRWGIIFNVSSYGSSTYFTIVYPDCEIESVNSNNVMPDLYRCRVGRGDASDYENWAAVREWVKARMNDKFGAPEEESEVSTDANND